MGQSALGIGNAPECRPIQAGAHLFASNVLEPNPRGALFVTDTPLAEISRQTGSGARVIRLSVIGFEEEDF